MTYYAGIDVSLEYSSVCVVDGAGKIIRLLMSTPGVGAIVALTYVAAIDDPARFKSSKGVGAHFGLTPKKYQSGETDITGRISKITPREIFFSARNPPVALHC